MTRNISKISYLVNDYDEAIDFFVHKLHFKLVEDTVLDDKKRWVLVAPSFGNSFTLLLAKADGELQEKYIGNQTGGRVFIFLNTDNFDRDYQNLLDQKIRIVREPKEEPYGTVCVFKDLYGNLWDLIEPKP